MTQTMNRTTSDEAARREHAEWVGLWRETSMLAAAGYPAPLTDEERSAYRTLPDLIDRCKSAWKAVPEAVRPPHYLLTD